MLCWRKGHLEGRRQLRGFAEVLVLAPISKLLLQGQAPAPFWACLQQPKERLGLWPHKILSLAPILYSACCGQGHGVAPAEHKRALKRGRQGPRGRPSHAESLAGWSHPWSDLFVEVQHRAL